MISHRFTLQYRIFRILSDYLVHANVELRFENVSLGDLVAQMGESLVDG